MDDHNHNLRARTLASSIRLLRFPLLPVEKISAGSSSIFKREPGEPSSDRRNDLPLPGSALLQSVAQWFIQREQGLKFHALAEVSRE